MVSLRELIPDADAPADIATREVAGLTADSRAVRPGFVFFAMPGSRVDGLSFAQGAIDAGAVAVVAERAPAQPLQGAPLLRTDNVRAALSHGAARFYAAQPATIAAVTGTSGKTSVAAFTRQIWARLGARAAALGTTGVITPDGETYGSGRPRRARAPRAPRAGPRAPRRPRCARARPWKTAARSPPA